MPQGQFCWYELLTTDDQAAVAFYKRVVGWESEPFNSPGMPYTIVKAGTDGVGGVMTIPEDAAKAGVPPHWIGYVFVDDVDAMEQRIGAAGGSVMKSAFDIPEVGRAAVVADPHGAVFSVFKSAQAMDRPPAAPMTPGHVGWHELHAGEREAAFAFYAGLFGWVKTSTVEMGPMGTYQLFATGEMPNGGMMTKMKETPRPGWVFYFVVPAIDAAVTRIGEAGGKVVNGPMEVPGGAWIVQGLDPQGALFALVAAAR